MNKVIELKKHMKAMRRKAHSKDKVAQLKKGLLRKESKIMIQLQKSKAQQQKFQSHQQMNQSQQQKPQSTRSIHTFGSSKHSQRVSRYSNVNIALLNAMRTNDTQQGEELEYTLSKQTKLEKRVSMLTIKRTMTCFFAIIFSIPFFLSSTYKPYLSEFVPIAKMIDNLKDDQAAYMQALNLIVDSHKDDDDSLIGLKAPGFEYKSEKFRNGEIRQLEQVKLKVKGITFTVYLKNSVRLYAIWGIWGYLISGILLIGFVVYINKDLDKYVIYPLESMYEKVTILSKNPMSATNEDFETRAGIVSLLQSK